MNQSCRNIITLHASRQIGKVPSDSTEGAPSNITPFVPPQAPESVYRLVDSEELAQAAQERLAMKLNRSLLCQLRTEGMPFVRFSVRRIRYDLAACLKWLILRSFEDGQNPKVDPAMLLASFGLNPTPNGAA